MSLGGEVIGVSLGRIVGVLNMMLRASGKGSVLVIESPAKTLSVLSFRNLVTVDSIGRRRSLPEDKLGSKASRPPMARPSCVGLLTKTHPSGSKIPSIVCTQSLLPLTHLAKSLSSLCAATQFKLSC
jgi:hypothetical protein